jgi:RsiW-degrading membrane proteinase PrsW (M82 family)
MGDQVQPQCIIPLHKPSNKELAFFFASGILLSFPFTLFFAQLYQFISFALAAVILAPIIEELAKVFPLFYRHGETERSFVTLGILIGLGFGISELVLYVAFLNTPLIVRIPGVIFHATTTAITAFGIAKKNPVPYYATAVILHAANNFFALETVDPALGLIIQLFVLIVAYLFAWRVYHQASTEKIVV